jgi:Effector-associated domain 11/Beta/Gamma crystallin
MIKQEVRNLISDGRLDEAISILLKLTEKDAHLYKQVGTISANYHNYKNRAATGQLSHQEQNQGTATIANGLLYVVDEIWKNGDIRVPPTIPQLPEPLPKPPYLQHVVGGISTLLVALGIWYYAPTPAVLEPHISTQPVVFKLHNKNGESALTPKITGKIILDISSIGYKDTAYINEESTAIFEKVPLKALKMMAEATLFSNDYNSSINGKSLRIDSTIDYPVIRKSITKITPPTEKPTNGGTSPPSDPPKVVYIDLTKVVLFEKSNYKGKVLELKDESNSLKNESNLNGKASSIRIPKGFHVLLYEQDNGGSGSGKAIILTQSANDLTPYDFDNRTSFVEVREVKTIPASNNGNGKIWIPHHFELLNGIYSWRTGSWTTPPPNATAWKEGTWEAASNGKLNYVAGHWVLTTRGSIKASDAPPPPVIAPSSSSKTRVPPTWHQKNR